jgi:glycerol uptake facilitator-like aquaporin
MKRYTAEFLGTFALIFGLVDGSISAAETHKRM